MVLVLTSCETDPSVDLMTESIPVCYAIFDCQDSVNNIILTKTFHGDPFGPYYNSKIFDSVYYKNAHVNLTLYYDYGRVFQIQYDTIRKTALEELEFQKKPGVFTNPLGQKFVLYQNLTDCYQIDALITTSSNDSLILSTRIIKAPIVKYPQFEGSFIELSPTQVFEIKWNGYSWNEVKIQFVIETTTSSKIIQDTLVFFKKGLNTSDHPYLKIFSTSFPYNAYLALLNSHLKNNADVSFRMIKDISVEVLCGVASFRDYMDIFNEVVDNVLTTYHSEPISLFSSKSSSRIAGLKFSQSTIEKMKNDPDLTKFKFKYW